MNPHDSGDDHEIDLDEPFLEAQAQAEKAASSIIGTLDSLKSTLLSLVRLNAEIAKLEAEISRLKGASVSSV